MIHGNRAVAPVQLVHKWTTGVGQPSADWSADMRPLWGFTATRSAAWAETAHAMTSAEIETVIEGFGRAAEFARDDGLNGVERG